MGNYPSKTNGIPEKGTPAWYIHSHKGPRFCQYLSEWHALTGQDPKRQFPLSAIFDRDNLNFLCYQLDAADDSRKPGNWSAFFVWYAEMEKTML